jgi:hypothetical protein
MLFQGVLFEDKLTGTRHCVKQYSTGIVIIGVRHTAENLRAAPGVLASLDTANYRGIWTNAPVFYPQSENKFLQRERKTLTLGIKGEGSKKLLFART